MKAWELNRAIERRGGYVLRQTGSHRRYEAVDDSGTKCKTTVAQHPGDVPTGTLRQIERDMEPVFGKGWPR